MKQLFLYLAATDQTLTGVLLMKEWDKQLSVYYVSKILYQKELN